jgi:hypothetical protein
MLVNLAQLNSYCIISEQHHVLQKKYIQSYINYDQHEYIGPEQTVLNNIMHEIINLKSNYHVISC